MTLSQYIRSKGYKLTVRRLAEVSLYTESGLWRMYQRDPEIILELIRLHKDQLELDG